MSARNLYVVPGWGDLRGLWVVVGWGIVLWLVEGLL